MTQIVFIWENLERLKLKKSKYMLLFDQLEPFQGVNFFQCYFDLHKKDHLPVKKKYNKPYLLPDTSELLCEKNFADLSICYNEKGVYVDILVHKPFEDIQYTYPSSSDCLELFFDTRDLKTANVIHKFCHHFIFFPKPQGEVSAIEITKIRGHEQRPLCENHLLHVESLFHQDSYEMLIFIEAQGLYGFDPSRCDRLGFTYKVNRKKGPPQHFNVSSKDYSFEKHPQLWATLNLMR